MKFSFAPCILVVLLACTACSWFGKNNVEKPAHELIQDGVQAYDKGQYRDALKNFEQLKDWYPFSKYAILAELKIADSHYHLQEYEEAVQAYQEFEQLHPRNEAIPYVVYQIGRSYYDRIDTIDRDQGSTQKALETFKRLIQQYPTSPYAQQSRAHILICLKDLAEHDFYVAIFYYKSEHYKAALHRFLDVITQYPDTGVQFKALQYLADCEERIKSAAPAGKQVMTLPSSPFDQERPIQLE